MAQSTKTKNITGHSHPWPLDVHTAYTHSLMVLLPTKTNKIEEERRGKTKGDKKNSVKTERFINVVINFSNLK